jgi:NagD protein
MMRAARKDLGLATSETIMIGDTMETDILGGVAMGYHTVLVLSGGTRAEDLARHAFAPDLVVGSLADLDPSGEEIVNLVAPDLAEGSLPPGPKLRAAAPAVQR